MSKSVQKVQCRGCGQFFVSDTIFDYHRVGDFGKRERRCLTAEEMQSKGLTTEKRQVHLILEGRDVYEEHDVWYSPADRERVRQAFGRGADEEKEDD